ncbi:MAG: ribonuclease E/G [Sneathiellales bacterium]|nr:ribonuclease E/G [Sneathiellales bacterium]
MASRLIIEETILGQRAAVLEEDRLTDLFLFPNSATSKIGSFYLARISTVTPELDAVFLDLDGKEQAFLSRKEIPADYLIHEGAKLPVQIIKDATGEKPAEASAYLKLEGKLAVIKSHGSALSFSKSLKGNAIKDALTEALANSVQTGATTIRSQAKEATLEDILAEIKTLFQKLQSLIAAKTANTQPRKLDASPSPLLQALTRLPETPSRIDVKGLDLFNQLKTGDSTLFTDMNIHLHTAKERLFDKNDVEDQIDEALEKRITLPSGGWITIEKTEALIAIDVNSGTAQETGSSEQIHQEINHKAAKAIASQCRLRNLSGILIIDFLKMQEKGAAQKLITALKSECCSDPAAVRIIGMTELGLMQMTRQRTLQDLQSLMSLPALPGFSGLTYGKAQAFLAALERHRAAEPSPLISLKCGRQISELLRLTQEELEETTSCSLNWIEDHAFKADQYSFF